MSNYSSFKKQQLLTEAWRSSIQEVQEEEEETYPAQQEAERFTDTKKEIINKINKNDFMEDSEVVDFINSILDVFGADIKRRVIVILNQQQRVQGLEEQTIYDDAVLEDGTLVCAGCLEELLESERTVIQEAKYQGRSVTLNKPMKGDVKKFKVYVKDPKTGNVKKVNFGDPNMRIKKSNPARRKSFRARHNCANPGPKTKARYWSCKKW